jgi:hypothetical protein
MARRRRRTPRRKRNWLRQWFAWLPGPAARRRAWRAFRRAPTAIQLTALCLVVFTTWLGVNWIYQVARKPTELLFPISGALYKTPPQTWRAYGSVFRRHSTATITPELLAALAQTEASGNPVARTYWRWSFTNKPFDVYKPASSAVGMYQITDGTFEIARRYCVHNHVVVEDGPWHAWRSCWFNGAYSRVVPSHAVEMTSAYLDRQVAMLLNGRTAPLPVQQNLATLIHLCGAGTGNDYVRRGFRLAAGQRCGDHAAQRYLDKVAALRADFQRLNDREG